MSLSLLANIPLGESCAVISISSPGNIPYVEFPPCTLRLTFSDLENPGRNGSMLDKLFLALDAGPAGRLGESYWRYRSEVKQAVVPFRRSHAISIYRFIQQVPDTVKTLYIHCDFGKSRSPAVALAIQHLFGCEILFKELKIAPNKFVTGVFAATQSREGWVSRQLTPVT